MIVWNSMQIKSDALWQLLILLLIIYNSLQNKFPSEVVQYNDFAWG